MHLTKKCYVLLVPLLVSLLLLGFNFSSLSKDAIKVTGGSNNITFKNLMVSKAGSNEKAIDRGIVVEGEGSLENMTLQNVMIENLGIPESPNGVGVYFIPSSPKVDLFFLAVVYQNRSSNDYITLSTKPNLGLVDGEEVSFLGEFYDLSGSADFNGRVEIRSNYNGESLTSVEEELLNLYKISEADSGSSESITSGKDLESGEVIGSTNSFSYFSLGYPPSGRVTAKLAEGYNLFSPPGEPQESDPQEALGDDIDPLYMYRWNPAKGDYDGVSDIKLKAGESYWIYAWNDNTQIDLDINEPVSYSIEFTGKGWQMTGSPYSINWGDVELDGTKVENKTSGDSYAGPLKPYIFSYDEANDDYNLAQPSGWNDLSLNKWDGYWVKTTQSDVKLSFDKGDSVSASAAALESNNQSILVDPASADVTLPPPPPAKPSKVKGLQAIASPTLVRDSDGVTFTVRSSRPVDGLQAEVLTANGKNVWNKNTNKSKLTWNAGGVANGIYLYTVSARIDGKLKQAGVGKLLVLK